MRQPFTERDSSWESSLTATCFSVEESWSTDNTWWQQVTASRTRTLTTCQWLWENTTLWSHSMMRRGFPVKHTRCLPWWFILASSSVQLLTGVQVKCYHILVSPIRPTHPHYSMLDIPSSLWTLIYDIRYHSKKSKICKDRIDKIVLF